MANSVRATAPCRADLAGGTLDIWPLGLLHPGALTVNMALPVPVVLDLSDDGPDHIVQHRVSDSRWRSLSQSDISTDLTAAICFQLIPSGGLRVDVSHQAPVGSGLGGSSTYGIALAKAVSTIAGLSLSDNQVVRLVQNLEARLLGIPTGCQDHWAALRGGVQALHLEPEGDRIESLAVDHRWLASRVSVFFTGITHHSGMVNWQVIRRRLDGDKETTHALQKVVEAAKFCRQSLLQEDSEAVGRALRDEWSARQTLAPEVCPPEIKQLEARALRAGATAFKACGAGGGGSVLIWHAPEHAGSVAEAMTDGSKGGIIFANGVESRGCIVV